MGAALDPALSARLTEPRRALARLDGRLSPRLLTARLERGHERLGALQRLLVSLGPEAVLARGFAIVRGAAGDIVTRAAHVAPGDALEIQFADARVQASAGGPTRKPSRRKAPTAGQPSLFDED